jgi:hypothetical protein
MYLLKEFFWMVDLFVYLVVYIYIYSVCVCLIEFIYLFIYFLNDQKWKKKSLPKYNTHHIHPQAPQFYFF